MLLVKSQNGDADAYREFLAAIYQIASPLVQRRVKYNQEDVVQDVVLSVHKARHTFDISRPFFPWLYSIINFRLADQKRSFWKQQKKIIAAGQELAVNPPQSANENEALRDAVKELPENQRKIVTLLKLGGFSIKEVASMLGMSVPAVKNSASRAYNTLRDLLTEARHE